MKCLILAGEGAIQQVRIGYANAMAHIGFQCLVWHPNSGKPVFDVFDEFEPEVVFCGTWELSRALVKNLLRRPHIKLILWGSNFGSFDKEINTQEDPVLMASVDELKAVEQITKKLCVDYIFSYYHKRWVEVTHDGWKKFGLKPIGLPLAADMVSLGIGQPSEALKCDVSYIGGYWPYKGINLNKYLLPLCYPSEGLKVKIFGYGNWPVAQHLGMLDNTVLPILFSSSTVNANVFEPLAQKYGFDVNERCYKVMACGGFCVSESCDSAVNDIFTGGEICFADNPIEFKEKILYYIAHPEERQPFIEKGKASAKMQHNYFLRLSDVMSFIGLDNKLLVSNLNTVIKDLQSD